MVAIIILLHLHSSQRQELYLVNSNPVLVNYSHAKYVYEEMKGDTDEKSSLENSLYTEMATTTFNDNCGDSEGTYEYIKN